MTPEDLALLRSAVQRLENPSLAGRLTKLVGKPIQLLGSTLPPAANALIAFSSRKAIEAAVGIARKTLTPESNVRSSRRLHMVLATVAGAAGGAFGLASMPVASREQFLRLQELRAKTSQTRQRRFPASKCLHSAGVPTRQTWLRADTSRSWNADRQCYRSRSVHCTARR
jgi:hypothetical protein